MSIGQFFLGVVAVFVATIAYRWQKILDRETHQKQTLSALYSQYVSALTLHVASQPMIGDHDAEEKAKRFSSMDGQEADIYSLRDQIWLLAPDSLVVHLAECDQAFRDWKIKFHSDFKDGSEKKMRVKEALLQFNSKKDLLLAEMRKDLASQVNFEFNAFIPSFLKWRRKP